jgi:ABC-type bacteriocin/lantibiotic exporter with double-glycine peptidase domain
MNIIKQRANGDCGIASLAMFLEMTYEDVYVAFAKLDAVTRGKAGTHGYEVIAAAKSLGCKLTPTRKYDLDDDEGVLRVRWNSGERAKTGGHWVAIKAGLILCPSDALAVPWREYMERFDGRPCSLLKGLI